MIASDVVILMVKYPEPGRVKTRLARRVGNKEAADLYRSLVESMATPLKGFPTQIAYDPPSRQRDIQDWLGWADGSFAQEGENLGQRLQNAMHHGFAAGAKKVLVVGSDTMGLTHRIVSEAFATLDREDVAIGPAKDGGYYALGLTRDIPEIFEDIPWSTSDVLARTIKRVEALGLSMGTLPTLQDMDTEEDIED